MHEGRWNAGLLLGLGAAGLAAWSVWRAKAGVGKGTVMRLLEEATRLSVQGLDAEDGNGMAEHVDGLLDAIEKDDPVAAQELRYRFLEMKLEATQQKLRDVIEERESLKQTLVFAEATAVDFQDSNDSSGRLSDSAIETLKAMFESFDTNHTGFMRLEDIKDLHFKLGEPLTEEEAQSAMKEMDKSGTGCVTFTGFLHWWVAIHKDDRKNERYSQRFKLLNAKFLDPSGFDHARVFTTPSQEPGSLSYRIHFHYRTKSGLAKPISPWHDIPLYHFGQGKDAKFFNFICEIPKWTRAKFEIATGEQYNPIKQDVRNGSLRYYKYGDMLFNYGCFPQTWEDPNHVHPDTNFPGDNDPIDVLEIGTRSLSTGTVEPVKILGIIALIDDGETDWKVLAISINDPLAHELKDVLDIQRIMPRALDAIRQYFRLYKVFSGSPENKFALNERAAERTYSIKIVEECHQNWKELRSSMHGSGYSSN